MSNIIVKFSHVNKKYKNDQALKNCSFELKKGKIYGLIGKNGAGKTTIMRIIAGLSIPTSGEITLFGENQKGRLSRRIGSLIESPTLNGGMSAEENLKFYKMLYGVGENQNQRLLTLVGLEDVGQKKVKDFSLGMKQRLGIAIAMIGNPEFVMLDEPINGLDPIGVIEIRNLIKRMCNEFGITVLISSHNLPELYQTATDYIIIDKGEVKQQITLEELEQEKKENLEEYFIAVIEGEKND